MEKKEFYDKIASILGASHEYSTFNDVIYRFIDGKPCPTNATRWGGRSPGNGRFPGFGIVRLYGNTVHIALTKPIGINAICTSKEEAVEMIEKIINNS